MGGYRRWSRGYDGDYGYGGWTPRPNAAARKRSAAREVAALEKKGRKLAPIVVQGRAIARTFWGKAWCENLERYSDYANRLPRGRTYVRSGSVLDLQIAAGRVTALVQGSSLYDVKIEIDAVPVERWKALVSECAGGIDSLIELLQGKVSDAVMAAVTRAETGLFPAPARIRLGCSCPDWATMCKHVAAVLYGVGARLDEAPELLFRLRGTDPTELVATAATAGLAQRAGVPAASALAGADLSSVFGIELEAPAPAPVPKAKKRKTRAAPATITRAELVRLDVTPATIQRWLKAGVLLATSRRGVYEKTAEAKERILAYEEALAGTKAGT